MDAKTKANFINSVAKDHSIPCPSCGGLNHAEAKFCKFCGTKLMKPIPQPAPEPAPVPRPVSVPEPAPAPQPVPDSAPALKPMPELQPVSKENTPFKSIDRPQPVHEQKPEVKPVEKREEHEDRSYYEEPVSVFAQGLPEWSVEPPEVMVRRKRKR